MNLSQNFKPYCVIKLIILKIRLGKFILKLFEITAKKIFTVNKK